MMNLNIKKQGWWLAFVFVLITAVACGSSTDEQTTENGEGMTTESGLQYIEVEAGTGEQAKAGDLVSVHYVGTLEDGTEFDNSLNRGKPIEFVLGKGMAYLVDHDYLPFDFADHSCRTPKRYRLNRHL